MAVNPFQPTVQFHRFIRRSTRHKSRDLRCISRRELLSHQMVLTRGMQQNPRTCCRVNTPRFVRIQNTFNRQLRCVHRGQSRLGITAMLETRRIPTRSPIMAIAPAKKSHAIIALKCLLQNPFKCPVIRCHFHSGFQIGIVVLQIGMFATHMSRNHRIRPAIRFIDLCNMPQIRIFVRFISQSLMSRSTNRLIVPPKIHVVMPAPRGLCRPLKARQSDKLPRLIIRAFRLLLQHPIAFAQNVIVALIPRKVDRRNISRVPEKIGNLLRHSHLTAV